MNTDRTSELRAQVALIAVPLADETEAEVESENKTLVSNNPQASSSANKIDAQLPVKSAFSEKPKFNKNFKKRRQSEEQNTQWLGDKVIFKKYTIALPPLTIILGSS